MKKEITYKAIFTSNNSKETVEMKSTGYVYYDPMRILFDYENTHIEIEVEHDNILLKNNDSLLKLNTKEVMFNNYKLPYGYSHFKSRVEMFEASKDHLYLKYVLFDDISEITQAYLKITFKDLLN